MTKEEIIKHLHEALNYVDITFPYRYVLVEAIEALSHPSLPSNLDEAAEEYGEENQVEYWSDAYNLHTSKKDLVDAFKSGAEWMAGQYFPRWRKIDEEKPKRGEDCACITVTVNGHIKYSNFEEGPWSWDDKVESEWVGTEAFVGDNDYGDKEYHSCSHWMPWDEFIGVLERQFMK